MFAPDARATSAENKKALRGAWPRAPSLATEEHAQGQQHSLQTQFATLGLEPLGGGVGSAALAAGADGYRGEAQRQRDVGIGRGAIQVAADSQMRIDGANAFKQRRAFLQSTAGARPDFFHS